MRMLFHLNSLLLLSAFVVVCYRPKVTNAMSFPSPQVTSKTDVSPISNQNHHNHQSISLASNYKVVIKSNKAGFETWELFSILGDTDNDRARCSKACLKRNHDDDDDGSNCCSEKCFTLQCIKVEGDENDSCTVKVQVDQHIADDALCREENELLIQVLCRIILQRTLSNDPSILYGSLPDLNDILSRKEVLSTSIFDKLSKKSEIVEMVNQDGVPLATVPRDLIHKLNLLHRGIGIVVSKDEHIRQGMVSYPDVYCHQRTSTKRIFPSLYDMFVGGVSEAGEESNVTAAREVAEELGLKRGLSGALSEPLFNCAVCTSYNRCIVTVFTYECNSVVENVTWQEEEVQWGDYVPYSIVEISAQLSIERLIEENRWPGKISPSYQPRSENVKTKDININEAWKSWDYVPDGLLVWEAWKEWMMQQKS